MISLHGGTSSHFDKETEEIIPYIAENKLDSLQVLYVTPRNCENLTSSDILDNVALDCYHLYKREVPTGKTKGFLEKIDGVPLDKKIKKIIKSVYKKHGFPNFFKTGYDLKRIKNDIGGLQAFLTTDPINAAGYLTTYFWEKGFPYYISKHSIDKGSDAFSNGVVVLKDTNYYLAPNFYQIDGAGFEFLKESCRHRQRDYTLRLCNDDFKDDKEGIEYSVEVPYFYTRKTIGRDRRLLQNTSRTYLFKIFIDKDTQKVYIKQLAGYNFLSSPLFIHYIENYRMNPENYNFTDIYGNHISLFNNFSNELIMCNSLSTPILQNLKIIPESSDSQHVENVELMLSTLYNFELNSWFENDGYVCYQGFICRCFDISNITDMKDFYDGKKCRDDSLACKMASKKLPMSPRNTTRKRKRKTGSNSSSSNSSSSNSSSSNSSSSNSSSSNSSSSSKNRPHSRNRRVLNAYGGK